MSVAKFQCPILSAVFVLVDLHLSLVFATDAMIHTGLHAWNLFSQTRMGYFDYLNFAPVRTDFVIIMNSIVVKVRDRCLCLVRNQLIQSISCSGRNPGS